jgi:hypothetical protein
LPNRLIWFTGNRDPSISETITTSDGVAVDLTGDSARFRCRAVGSSTLLVDQPVSNTLDATGFVRYDWSAADASSGALSEARDLLVWWQVTQGGKTQDMNEAVISVYAHAPLSNGYIELEELKATKELTGKTYADADLRLAIVAASRGIDEALGRRFYPDADANQVRYYSPAAYDRLWIDDLVTLTELASDSSGGTSFGDVWTANTDFVLEPLNPPTGYPWTRITVHPSGSRTLPCGYPRSVRVTGKFGWAAPPSQVKTLTAIVAARLVKRTREAPHGIIQFGVEGAVVRASAFARDPEYQLLTMGLDRSVPVA